MKTLMKCGFSLLLLMSFILFNMELFDVFMYVISVVCAILMCIVGFCCF